MASNRSSKPSLNGARRPPTSLPGVGGFSRQNIWRMRAFYLAWTETVLSQPARELKVRSLPQAAKRHVKDVSDAIGGTAK